MSALHPVTAPPAMHPLCQYWWPANPMELQYFHNVFASADPSRSGRLSGSVGAALLLRSGAPKEVLKQV